MWARQEGQCVEAGCGPGRRGGVRPCADGDSTQRVRERPAVQGGPQHGLCLPQQGLRWCWRGTQGCVEGLCRLGQRHMPCR